MTNEEVNAKFIIEAKILNECICDRNHICAVLGECFKRMGIVKALAGEHHTKIKHARSFATAVNVLKLTKGGKKKLKSYYPPEKPAKKKIPVEYQERRIQFTSNDDFVKWYREQQEENFHEAANGNKPG